MAKGIDVPQEVQDTMSGSMADGVELPFPVCYMFIKNGRPEMSQIGGIGYFGGWAMDADDADGRWDNIGEQMDRVTFSNREGDTYDVYTSRSILAAPIAKRRQWRDGRSHVQILAMVGVVNKGKFVDLGPNVLTAKGWQASYLQDSFRAWDKYTAEARREQAGGADSKFFYACIGTSGDANFVAVGKTTTSQITPIELIVPDNLNLNKLYVGDEKAREMSDLFLQAGEWLEDWTKRKDNQPADDYEPGDDNPFPDF